jgi:hypothetical protein
VETARLYLENWGLRSPRSEDEPLSPSSLQEDMEMPEIYNATNIEGSSNEVKTNCMKNKNIQDIMKQPSTNLVQSK